MCLRPPSLAPPPSPCPSAALTKLTVHGVQVQQQRLHSPLEARLAHNDQAPVQGLVDGHKDKVKGEQVNSLGRCGGEVRDRDTGGQQVKRLGRRSSLADGQRVTAIAAPNATVISARCLHVARLLAACQLLCTKCRPVEPSPPDLINPSPHLGPLPHSPMVALRLRAAHTAYSRM